MPIELRASNAKRWSNLADLALTTTGQLSVTTVLTAGTYYISIQLAVMGPGFYSITYNPRHCCSTR